MSLADFNKDNPFVIIMRKLEMELYKKSMNMTKKLVVISFVTLLASIITIKYSNIIPLIAAILLLLQNLKIWHDIVTKGEFATVNKIIYGNEFSGISVNNEKLFEIIQNMTQAKGELEYFNKKIYIDGIIIMILIIASIIINII